MTEKKEPTDDTRKDVYSLLAQHVSGIIMPIIRRQTEHVELKVNKHLFLCHLLVLSSPTLMMHGHMNLKFVKMTFPTRSSERWWITAWAVLF